MKVLLEASSLSADRGTSGADEAAMRGFWRLADSWRLSVEEQMTLLGIGHQRYRSLAACGTDSLESGISGRLSHLFAIHASVQSVLLRPEDARGWVRQPLVAPPFNGRSPLSLMLGGEVADLVRVRRYLAAQGL